MTFLEKSAWVMILALIVSGAFYALSVYGAAAALETIPPPNGIGMGVAVVIIVAIAIFGHAVAVQSGLLLFLALFASVVSSQIAEYVLTFWFYRRGV